MWTWLAANWPRLLLCALLFYAAYYLTMLLPPTFRPD